VIGIDWRTPLDEAWKKIGHEKAIQGNLDPALLFGSQEHLAASTVDVLEQAANRDGHVFNLGHGVFPGTPVENVSLLVDLVHSKSKRS
jgi:uroporphyrinogen decarboxylase